MSYEAELWNHLEQAHQRFRELVGRLKSLDKDTRLQLVRKGYKNRALTVDVLEYLGQDELKELLPFLLSHARSVHPYLGRIRHLIVSLPKEWLLERLEAASYPMLEPNDDEAYRRFLELYFQIDPQLTKRLAEQALQSSDPNVRDAGRDFMEKLRDRSGVQGK